MIRKMSNLNKMNLINQTKRDVLLAIIILLAILIFWESSLGYLSELKNPLPMMAALVFSLLLGCFYELKDGATRAAFISLTTSCLFFSIAPSLADIYRDYYLYMLDEIEKGGPVYPELLDSNGEYISAIHNPAFGIGSCFALALTTLRLPFQKITTKALSFVFIVSVKQVCCPLCGQTVPKSAEAALANIDENKNNRQSIQSNHL